MSGERLTRQFLLLRALRWLPLGLVLPFLTITPVARGLSLEAVGAIFAVHSAVLIVLEVPSGVLADSIGRRRVLLIGATLTAASLAIFALAQSVAAFAASLAALAGGRALISGALEAWYVDSLRALDPQAPLHAGLSRGAAAEGLALALGSLAGGALVAVSGSADAGESAFSGYGLAALAGAVAALVYLWAVASLVRDQHMLPDAHAVQHSIRVRIRRVLATARAEIAASVIVRVVFTTAIGFGIAGVAVELLWQPHLADLLNGGGTDGFAFGALAAGSMLAVALGASISPMARRRLRLGGAYLTSLVATAVCIAALGAPDAALPFAALYLLVYLSSGISEPLHMELLNDAVGSDARATLISAESLAGQGGALIANLGTGAFAAAHGVAAAWIIAGSVLGAAVALVAVPLLRARVA